MNSGYPDLVCDNMIDKTINDINCVEVRENSDNNGTMDSDLMYNATFIKVYNGSDLIVSNVNRSYLEEQVCKAEIDSQILDSKLNAITSPFGKF